MQISYLDSGRTGGRTDSDLQTEARANLSTLVQLLRQLDSLFEFAASRNAQNMTPEEKHPKQNCDDASRSSRALRREPTNYTAGVGVGSRVLYVQKLAGGCEMQSSSRSNVTSYYCTTIHFEYCRQIDVSSCGRVEL
ncbi:hypothetical protein PR002_g30552 [Phytophthora rubi]|uniref:Uncharacterized protein n=1 Tax=Phytophthora rubi TaxID=129364 RepID=A0A6A3GP01_9STRA|nr:hypothetical protein PR002_g30552 [Phytophthora rubi]